MTKIKVALLIAICSALMACATPWKRADGGEFKQSQYEMDRSLCDSEARKLVTGQTIRPFSETRVANQFSGAIVTQFRVCMSRKGWEMK
jgi:hypothetical protein